LAQTKWQPLFETGVAHIDKQHRELLRILNALERAVAAGSGDEAVVVALSDMTNYTAIHFRTEESYMRAINYPELKHHADIHSELVSRVKVYLDRARCPSGLKAEELLAMLTDWLIDHIVVEDKKIARWAEVRRTVNA
jgi:hemerythrin-like metal-binding protein